MIRGEYWIIDGSVDFADGDVGDFNHESIALDHIFRQWAEPVKNVAEEYGIETDFESYDQVDSEAVFDTIGEILEILQQDHNEQDANNILMQQLGMNRPTYLVICGRGHAVLYVMEYEGWIALRGTSADLFGFDEKKRKSLSDGIEEILYQEGGEGLDDEEDDAEEPLEINVTDHKTGKTFYFTLQDLQQPQQPVRPTQQPINTKGDVRFSMGMIPDEEENKYSARLYNPYVRSPLPKTNPWEDEAKKQKLIGPGQQMWRGTSESFSFKSWLLKQS